MAKQQQDKEDILREATALVNRIEIKFSRDAVSKESVFVGFVVTERFHFSLGLNLFTNSILGTNLDAAIVRGRC